MFILSMVLSISAHAQVEQVVWDTKPIPLQLQVETEQIVRFPDSVQAALPPELLGALAIQAVNDSLYVTAHRNFPKQRILVRSVGTGAVYLLDIHAASEPVPDRIIQIVAPRTEVTAYSSVQPLTYVRLTQYAAQQLFAPKRLLRRLHGISRHPVSRVPVDLVRALHVEVRPLAAWKATGLYVTAVELTNLSSFGVDLHPEQVRGQWKTMTLHRFSLDPADGVRDRTVAYLVSEHPFEIASRASGLEP